MSTASLGTRLKKLQTAEDGLGLEQWTTRFLRHKEEVPDYALISIMAGRMLPKHLANAVFDHRLCVAWREGPDFTCIHFPDWLIVRGTSVDAIVDEIRRAR